jgi:hypothetical protein
VGHYSDAREASVFNMDDWGRCDLLLNLLAGHFNDHCDCVDDLSYTGHRELYSGEIIYLENFQSDCSINV